MDMSDNGGKAYWMWLSHACGQGSACAVELVRCFGDAEAVYAADEESLRSCGVRISKSTLAKLCIKELFEEKDILDWCERCGVQVLVPGDGAYPKSLLSLQDAPMVLYCVGNLPDFDKVFSCAVVGTRTMTDYGKECAYRMGTGLADGGACLVSGLALGIDGMAMAGAVEAGGACVAVLGCGVDIVYPKAHEKLLHRVLEKGAVISEYAPGVSPSGYHFPVRNRIISGISRAVCVVEGNMSSGSLITARHAVFQGKSVYAFPGRVGDEGAQAPNFLLKMGASAVTDAGDILKDYEFLYPHSLHQSVEVPHIDANEAARLLGVERKGKNSRGSEPAGNKQETGAGAEKTATAAAASRSSAKKVRDTAKKADKGAAKKGGAQKESVFPQESAPVRARADISSLSEKDMLVFDAMLPDTPVLADELCGKCKMSVSEILVSLTMLELCGSIEAGAGGYFVKRAADSVGADYIGEEDDGL